MVDGTMMEAGNDVIYGFTDGSCRGNPGSCGAGACIFLSNQERVDIKQPASKDHPCFWGACRYQSSF